jgi:hypothetical protein
MPWGVRASCEHAPIKIVGGHLDQLDGDAGRRVDPEPSARHVALCDRATVGVPHGAVEEGCVKGEDDVDAKDEGDRRVQAKEKAGDLKIEANLKGHHHGAVHDEQHDPAVPH